MTLNLTLDCHIWRWRKRQRLSNQPCFSVKIWNTEMSLRFDFFSQNRNLGKVILVLQIFIKSAFIRQYYKMYRFTFLVTRALLSRQPVDINRELWSLGLKWYLCGGRPKLLLVLTRVYHSPPLSWLPLNQQNVS